MINKDTKIYGSFSQKAGNKGCEFFNKLFQEHYINAIYKSFSINNIQNAVLSATTLGFSGFAVSMPFKRSVMKYIDVIDEHAQKIEAVNTVIYDGNKLFGYNTDYIAAHQVLLPYQNKFTTLIILGNGGYASAVKYAGKLLGFHCINFNRQDMENLNRLNNQLVFNCTPVENIQLNNNCAFIDCITSTDTGSLLSNIQAKYQFKLYTGINIE